MTGRHAAPPDDSFDAQERARAGSHRADGDPQGDIGDGSVPADADMKPAEPASKKPTPKPPSTPKKKAGTR